MTRAEPIVIPGLEILTKLSSGGMGDVLLARRRGVHGFEKLLAVKTIRGDLARRNDIRAMFHDEAKLVARLDHPAIAQVYDFGEEDGLLYLAMEYVPGLSLNKLLVKRQRPVPHLIAARIAADVCRGLHAAHQLTDMDGKPLGVVHRDVTPGNVILTFDGHVKILDFGIAFMNERESPDTQVGELKGKPSYMAPEQLRGERVDRRSDLYSLSVVLHEMLTGRKLFTKNNITATVLAVERGEVPLPSSVVPEIPKALEDVVMKGLERDAALRFSDARSMAQALDEVVQQHNGPPLETFVESDLSEDVAQHRQWMQAVLAGEDVGAGTYDSFIGRQKTPSNRTPVPHTPSPRTPSPRTPAPRTPVPEEVRVLADPLTLVPPATSEPAVRAPEKKGISPTWVSASIFAVAVGIFFASRERQEPVPIQPLAPLEAQAQTAPEPELPEGDATEVEALPEPKQDKPEEPRRPKPTKKVEREEPEKPKVEKVEDRFGSLTVGAQPYALVRINGKQVGTTPLLNFKLPVGQHEVQLVSPDSGEVRLSKQVQIVEGGRERVTLP